MTVAASLVVILSAAVWADAPQAGDALKSIVQSYLTIQTQLAADKIDGVKEPSRAIAAKAVLLGGSGVDVAQAAGKLESAADIKSAREAFGALTDAVMAAGAAQEWKGVEGVRLAFCPMVDRSWLQKDGAIRNPYYGSAMLTCGEFKPLKK